jgi:hypothetical protein
MDEARRLSRGFRMDPELYNAVQGKSVPLATPQLA